MRPAPRRPQRSAFTPATAGFSLTPATAGFSLTEALVAAVFAAAGSVLLSHIRSSSQLELAQRQLDNAARL